MFLIASRKLTYSDVHPACGASYALTLSVSVHVVSLSTKRHRLSNALTEACMTEHVFVAGVSHAAEVNSLPRRASS